MRKIKDTVGGMFFPDKILDGRIVLKYIAFLFLMTGKKSVKCDCNRQIDLLGKL